MENKKKISIASDHAGTELKSEVVSSLKIDGYDVLDNGPFNKNSVDYPDYAKIVASDINESRCDFGILICGSGQGMAITANKQSGIRAALCYTPEIAELSRAHNNCNVLTLGSRFIDKDSALKCINVFLNTPFEGGRHQDRINKIL
jgi:ribose 5-phosphate isomerase B